MNNASDAIRAVLIGIAVALPVAFLLALLKVSYERREPIPWADMWRALTGRR
jgi:hypothetical protein